MPTFIDSIRAAADNAAGIIAAKEMSNYQVTLVNVVEDQVDFDSSAAARTRTDTLITVGNAIGPNLNPHVHYMNYKTVNNGINVLSGAALTNMELMLGPLIFPYNAGYQTGGIDPALFQPGPTAAHNTSIYVKVTGLGLNQANGNYFRVDEVVLSGMDNTFYYVKLVGIMGVIQ